MAAFGKLVLSHNLSRADSPDSYRDRDVGRLRTTLEMFLLVEHSGERGFLVSIFSRLEPLLSGVCNSGSNPKVCEQKKQNAAAFSSCAYEVNAGNLTMSDGGYKIRNKKEVHFITFAVVEWIDVFTRKEYRDIIVNSLKFCQKEKGLLLHGWCIMSNHVHFIASAKNEDLSNILRDFKKFTSKRIITAIEKNEHESRKDWMLKLFSEQGQSNSRNKNYQFWRQDNQPIELYSPKFFFQKLNYIHNNPVVAGIVEKPEHYLYSSARDYFERKKCGLLDVSFL